MHRSIVQSRARRRAKARSHIHRTLLRKMGRDFQVTIIQNFDAYEFELFPINLSEVSRYERYHKDSEEIEQVVLTSGFEAYSYSYRLETKRSQYDILYHNLKLEFRPTFSCPIQ